MGQAIWIAAFYALIVILVIVYRKRFEFAAKIGGIPLIALLKTQVGVPLMDKWGRGWKKFWRAYGYVSIVLGFAGMLLILVLVGQGVWNLFFRPDAPATFSLVVPGVKIPGSPITIPFIEGILSIFVVAVIHEFCHGVVSRAWNIPVKSSGIALFGPIFGAFVEPEEKALRKQPNKVQLSIFAAGPAINLITAFVFLFLMIPLSGALSGISTQGITFDRVVDGSAAQINGLPPGVIYTSVNGTQIYNVNEFIVAFDNYKPNETVVFGTNSANYSVTLGDKAGQAWIGIEGIRSVPVDEQKGLYSFLGFLGSLLTWLFLISLGIGMANLLPLGPIDGGRMIQLVFVKWFGKNKGTHIWIKLAIVLLAIVAMLILLPIFKALLPAIINLLG
ncbi:MAG: site-2 protease family protein [Candidatus Woesearchaeota archaeon]